ncbi:helix-turn-helix domain-containing protein [Leucobacter sp. USCH14]|uniref:helix-turn-helix domain-containing protein n=1 Tax=Leucobacter sp. USCH14 TaxID=3024838 RepID=UPI0030A62E97
MAPNAARPDAQQTRARVADLHAQGLSRNAIAREIGCSPSTVSKHSKLLGLSFDRTATAAAVAAQTVDLASRRAALVDRMMKLAEDTLSEIEGGEIEQVAITQRGDVVRTTRKPDMTDRRNGVTISGIAVDKATKLLDRDSGLETATSTLDALEAAVGAAARSLLDGDQTTD